MMIFYFHNIICTKIHNNIELSLNTRAGGDKGRVKKDFFLFFFFLLPTAIKPEGGGLRP